VEPEPVPEPLLSRQWGLLSKFQQARQVSARPAARRKAPPMQAVMRMSRGLSLGSGMAIARADRSLNV